MLIRGAELPGRGVVDLRVRRARIDEIGPGLVRARGEPELRAGGGALLPGLHDHHAHLFAQAAAARSLDCGPPAVSDAADLQRVLARAAAVGGGWLRGTGYHESVAGELGSAELDAWVPGRPLRMQHRSGSLWLLNSAALAALGALEGDAFPGLECDARGRPTGRLYRGDGWLRARLREAPPGLGAIGAKLAEHGVTGVTDAGAGNDAAALEQLAQAAACRALPQRLLVMGRPELPEPPAELGARVGRGAVKVLLDEARLPEFEGLVDTARAAHAAGRPLAVHCVTRTELVYTLAALREAGARPGDRIEHASVAPPETVTEAAALGVRVVTQPQFLFERGDQYQRDVEPADRAWLYRARAWLAAGVPLAAGSDAPYASADPWSAMRAAVERRSRGGACFDPAEALTPEAALALFTGPPEAPGDPARRLEPGAPADLCLLDRPWRDARLRLDAADVAACLCDGRLVYAR